MENIYFVENHGSTKCFQIAPRPSREEFRKLARKVLHDGENVDNLRFVVCSKQINLKDDKEYEKTRYLIKDGCNIFILYRLLGGGMIDPSVVLDILLNEFDANIKNCRDKVQTDCEMCFSNELCAKVCCARVCDDHIKANFKHNNAKYKCFGNADNPTCTKLVELGEVVFKNKDFSAAVTQFRHTLEHISFINCQICRCGTFDINETLYSQQKCPICARDFCFFCNRDWNASTMKNEQYYCSDGCNYKTLITYQLVPLAYDQNIKIPNRRCCPSCFTPGAYDEKYLLLSIFKSGFVELVKKPFFAFVEFKDSGYATSAMRRHNGYRHHPLDKPLVIDFDKVINQYNSSFHNHHNHHHHHILSLSLVSYSLVLDPRSRDDFSSSASTTSSSSSSSYRDSSDLRDTRDRDLDRGRNSDSHHSHSGGISGSHSHREVLRTGADYMDTSSDKDSSSYSKDRDESSRYHSNNNNDHDDHDDSDRNDKHRKQKTSDFDRFEKDRGRYRDSHFERDSYPAKRDFHGSMAAPPLPHHHGAYPDPTMPYFIPPRQNFDMKDANTTLFFSNLPKDVTERELSILFRFMRGFLNVRLVQRDGKYPICFCDFRGVPSAAIAMEMLNGFKMDPKDTSSSISNEFDRSRPRPLI
ncbi:hypothetical protein PPL_06895 [Heterostelium album PN500]|uniref:RRM domain-containing protein n=1 Tax=Heterostelium pallidum (strain ATCC 26659 / Pp 5 / PN500) TaxID=670386 RepID=D3BDU2_HETP5|nr:hypothetical protein PPL_06895 [Heterostelium album PN500]EFA80073.1 hypothetical protein PPL_06895 [Heterostelium album PN500]|eukprot:XP_020432193.1 hypothetical protein PPL_06895 [Heterostelium album PN500]